MEDEVGPEAPPAAAVEEEEEVEARPLPRFAVQRNPQAAAVMARSLARTGTPLFSSMYPPISIATIKSHRNVEEEEDDEGDIATEEEDEDRCKALLVGSGATLPPFATVGCDAPSPNGPVCAPSKGAAAMARPKESGQ